MEKYWYLVGFLGCMVNFLLTMGTNRLAGFPLDWKRCLLAGMIGFLHAMGCLMDGFSFLGNPVWRLIGMTVAAMAAFGCERSGFIRGALFVLLRLAMEGIAEGGVWPMLCIGAIVALLCGMGKPGQGNYATVSITHQGKTVELTALLDTGNTLTDPVSGKSVLVVDRDVAWELLGLHEKELTNPVETMRKLAIPGMRLIPYHAVGQTSGLLLGQSVDQIKINGQISHHILAFAPQTFGQGHHFQALAGGAI